MKVRLSAAYMKDASRTYAMSFFVASVGLSRSAVEAALRPRMAKYLGAGPARDFDLIDAINRAPSLDKAIRDLAHRVRIVGNDVIHDGKSVTADETLEIIEAARTVIEYVQRREAPVSCHRSDSAPSGDSRESTTCSQRGADGR
jgi:hypothetical protein